MQYAISVIYNFHHHPVHGMNFENITLGEDRNSFIPGAFTRTCIAIRHVKNKTEDYVEVAFNDDTFDRIYNYTRIIFAKENVYARILPNYEHKPDQEIDK